MLSPVSIQTQSLALRVLCALRKPKPQETQGHCVGNHVWLLEAFLAVFIYATHATHATQAIAFEWKPGFKLVLLPFFQDILGEPVT